MTPAPLNYRFRAGEIAALLDDSDAAVLVYTASLHDNVAEATAGRDIVLIAIDDTGTPDGLGVPWAEAVAAPAPLPERVPEDTELWVYTGGTTGQPKAAVWRADDLLALQLYSAYAPLGIDLPTSMQQVIDIARSPETPHVVLLPLAPFMHGTALFTAMNTLVVGGTVLVTSNARLDADQAVELILTRDVTRLVVAGDAVTLPVVDAAERAGVKRLGKVNSVISSGMRFSPEVKRRLHEMADVTIVDLLAATEAGPFAVTTTSSVDDLPGLPELQPNAVVLDENFNEVQDQPGARGILGLRGTLPMRYHGDEEKTRETFPIINGHRTVIPGDWVNVLPNRRVELLGRGSAVINTGGEKVYPAEVEEALVTHPKITDAAVVGVPDPRFGEVVAAVVVAESEVSEEELSKHLDEQLAGYKKPRKYLFRPSLERSPHGKVDLRRVRQSIIDAEQGADSTS